MFTVSVLVLFAVCALWLYAVVRRPRRFEDGQARRIAMRWIVGGGLGLPIASMVLLLAFGIPAGHRMLPLPVPGKQPLVVEVVGHQWWWEVIYPQSGVITANELYLPVGHPIDVQVTSRDVIHSFWVPNLAGKIDVQPARTHVHRLQADRVGSFRGQCSEFCGQLHAHMVMAVEVVPMEEFERWLAARAAPVDAARDGDAAQAFADHCGDCHRVAGISEGGSAPDLSNVGARSLLGGSPRDRDGDLHDWLTTNPRARQSELAPDHSTLAPGELNQIAQWLESLGHD